MRFSQEVITPEAAVDMMEKNHCKQRTIRNSRVREHARVMAAGEWREDSPEPIMVADDGTLLNGQHRLAAIILHNKPVKLTVCRGVSKDVFPYLDSGIPRELADRVHLDEDFTHAKNKVCMGIIALWLKTSKEASPGGIVSPIRAVSFYETHRDCLRWLIEIYSKQPGIGRLAAAVALCQMHERNRIKADAMARGYYLNTMDVPNAIAMREMMKSTFIYGKSGGWKAQEVVGRCITLCKAELMGKEIKRKVESIKPSRWDD